MSAFEEKNESEDKFSYRKIIRWNYDNDELGPVSGHDLEHN